MNLPTELSQSIELTPVDVEFESLFRELKKISSALKTDPADISLQKQFCQALRECRIAFDKVVDTYGKRYRSGRGADILIREAGETTRLLKQTNAGDILISIERHLTRLINLQETTFDDLGSEHSLAQSAEVFQPAAVR